MIEVSVTLKKGRRGRPRKRPQKPRPWALWSKEDMREVAALLLQLILARAARGVGSDGQPLKPYSEGYRQVLEAAGDDPNKVDLHRTGRLLGSGKSRGTKARGTAWFSAPYGGPVQALRPLAGMTPEEEAQLLALMARLVEKNLALKEKEP